MVTCNPVWPNVTAQQYWEDRLKANGPTRGLKGTPCVDPGGVRVPERPVSLVLIHGPIKSL